MLYGKRGLKAIEVKPSNRIRIEDFKGLNQFKEDYPETDLIYLYSGTRRFNQNDIEIVPIDMFFEQADNWI